MVESGFRREHGSDNGERVERGEYLVDVLTGIRPTGELTLANYLGAVKPIIELQESGRNIMVFVADLHALTTTQPSVARNLTREVVMDYIALGIDPERAKIFVQSDVANEVSTLAILFARYANVTELLRIPTLKDNLKRGQRPENANVLLLLYPILMAADILLQRAREVPIGEDQNPHLEFVRDLVRRFNRQHGNVLPLPRALQTETLRVRSLDGVGKMSKSNPEGALFLSDSPEKMAEKIRKAQTDVEGQMNDVLRSHVNLAKSLTTREEDRLKIDEIITDHLSGKKVMGEFKKIWIRVAQEFIESFQQRRQELVAQPSYIQVYLNLDPDRHKKGQEKL